MAKNTTKEATELIASAMRDALRTIANEARDAKHVVASDAETAANLLSSKNTESANDHNLLIRLDTKVDQIQSDISELKNIQNIYVTQIEHNEVVKIQVDHENRIRNVENTVMPKDKQEDFEKRTTKNEKILSNLWIYLALYGAAMGAIYTLVVFHILQK
jgi:uncharacterized Ntn-hydrolase superfamily protein